MKLSASLVAVSIAVAPLVSAAIFPKDSLVKMLDAKGFREAMKKNETSLVAFVAPWCGHCKNMVPEYSKAALGLHPLIPTYAVDCDAEKNKKLCAQQDVKGFPTVKVFPRGKSLPPMTYEQERTASGFYYFAARRVPKAFTKFYHVEEIPGWVTKHTTKHRALLLTKDKKVPLLWQVLGNKYSGTELEFGTHRDKKGKSSLAMGLDAGAPTASKVLLYPAGADAPILYEGLAKLESLSKFFDSVLDGTADLAGKLKEANEKAREEAREEEGKEESEEEREIKRKQEAQRIALLHGGFASMVDFEQAMKDGGANFHGGGGGAHGFGSAQEHLKGGKGEKVDPLPVHKEDEAGAKLKGEAGQEGFASPAVEPEPHKAEERPKDEL